MVVPVVPPPGATGTAAGFGTANELFLPTALDWMAKSKSTPICSKKLSETVMNRTSTEICMSWSRRSCRSRSTISSWTSEVWRMIRLMLR